MHITFLGTAAAEGFPDPFCACRNCEDARAEGGPSLRMHSAALVKDDLLIDLGPDLIAAAMRHNLRLNAIPWALQTHPHGDHLNSITLFARARMCQVREIVTMRLHCSATTVNWIDKIMFEDVADATFRDPAVQERFALAITEVAPWQAFDAGPYRVQSVEANHHMGIEAMLYAIEDTRTGDRLLYGTDTGPLPEQTWPQLAELGWAFDLVVLDHTFGFGARSGGHLNQEQFLEEVEAARAAGVLKDTTRIIATHLAHHSHPAHGEMARIAGEHGYEIAYDGWVADSHGAAHDRLPAGQLATA